MRKRPKFTNNFIFIHLEKFRTWSKTQKKKSRIKLKKRGILTV